MAGPTPINFERSSKLNSFDIILRSAWITMFMLALASCSPLEPLGEDDLANDLSAGTKIGASTSLIKNDTWNLSNIGRVHVPSGDIDPINLDGRVPDVVNYESVGSSITRYRIVNWGRLQLKDNGFFQFILQYSRFAVRSGADLGPTAACNADIRGVYGLRDGTIILYPERFPTERVVLQLDALGALRSLEMPTHCTGVESGAPFESNILLSNIVMNAVQ